MKQIKETEKLLLFERKSGLTTSIFRKHKESEDEPVKIYSYRNRIYTFPYEGEAIKKVIYEGFDEVPGLMNAYGYGFEDRTLNNYFRFNFNDTRITELRIVQKGKSKRLGSKLILRYEEIEELMSSFYQEQRAANDTKRIHAKNYLLGVWPELAFDYQETNNNKKLVLRNFNKRLIEQLTADEVDQVGKFYVNAALKFKRPDIVRKMTTSINKKSQLLTLNEVITKYENLLKDDPPEREWQKFFDEHITLFDSRYAHKLDYKNIATGLTKYPDLVLVDVYGYVDFYELKKSSTSLIKYDESHKTWYWSADISKVIAQASDYLQKAKENAVTYAKTIKEETATEKESGLDVHIINPKAIVVAGSQSELNTAKKQNHFKNLRESLKNIEFLLYDELLERLKNLLNTIKEN